MFGRNGFPELTLNSRLLLVCSKLVHDWAQSFELLKPLRKEAAFAASKERRRGFTGVFGKAEFCYVIFSESSGAVSIVPSLFFGAEYFWF